MSNLLEVLEVCKGKEYTCEVDGRPLAGKIQVEDERAYLCHNNEHKSGLLVNDRFGYNYSWIVNESNIGNIQNMKIML